MTCIEEILSRALLVRDRTMPSDIVAASASPTSTDARPPGGASTSTAAAEDLRALCETLVTHTPPTAVANFVTDQVPEPRSALILACVLQLTDTSDGARFWWQYAAGAGQAAAAYCLYLHHLALGESDAADWWHRQTDDVQPAPGLPVKEHQPNPEPPGPWRAAEHRVTSTSTTTILRVLRHLAKYTARPRPASVTALMTYVPSAVAIGYLRQPETELPMPGPDFARRISTLLASAANRPDVYTTLPARPGPRARPRPDSGQPAPRPSVGKPTQEVNPQLGEAATRSR
ncbi:hypothetical protein [Streptomyces sp. NBC_01334]|uniref:hypothetical protein n=1 Tax=Streptomyces sp. NBC_01334 TaxID=2903827 RepID=UPI002E0D46A3|nr:hypothetical protein OG736_45515 [Streptomyces sp. NBC_01334]